MSKQAEIAAQELPWVRLRANPEKVRVSVRRESAKYWRIEIGERGRDDNFVLHYAKKPAQGMLRALKLAEAAGIGGIDRGCDWAYPHPQKAVPQS